MSLRVKQDINLDASIMSHSACLRYVYNRVVLNKSPDKNFVVPTEFGSSWHVFRETLALSKNPPLAVGAAMKYWKMRESQGMVEDPKKQHLNPDYLMYLFEKYIDECGIEKSWGKYEVLTHPITDKPMVEQTFSILFYEDNFIRVFLQGTMDEWVRYASGFYCIGDDKTSSQWNHDEHLASFEMKIQGRFYLLAIRLLANMPGGEWFKRLRENHRLGFRINGVFLNPNKEKTVFKQSNPMFFTEADLDRLEDYLKNFCENLAHFVSANGKVHPDPYGIFNDSCNGKYGSKCAFFNACKSEERYERILANFPEKKYEPLTFRK